MENPDFLLNQNTKKKERKRNVQAVRTTQRERERHVMMKWGTIALYVLYDIIITAGLE